jgi:diguanylate cyclase
LIPVGYHCAMLNIQSLKFRLVALGVTLVVAGLGLRMLVALPFVQEQVRELVAAEQLSMATYIARDVDQRISARLALIDQLAADLSPTLIAQPEPLQAWMKDRQRFNPMFNSGLLLVRPDGHGLLAEYPAVPGRDALDYSASDWFRNALRSNRPVIGKPVHGRADGDPLIVMAAPVRDAAGHVLAVLGGVVSLNAPGFLDLLQETRLGASGGFLLVSPADRLFVAASDPAMVLKATPPSGVNLLHDRAMGGFRGTGLTVNAQGVEELSAMVSVPTTGWFVVARMPTTEAFRPVEAFRGFVVKNSLVVLVVMLVLLSVLLPRMLRPLTDAARLMRDMAMGKTELAPLPVVRDDEVGNLVNVFNYLVARLREKEIVLKASEARLAFMAHHDSLTGLPNRVMLEDRLQQALARTEREGSNLALLFCDLDGFKPINDRHGHGTGDAVLCQVAERLTDGRRRTDTVARLGGDEFVILLVDLDDAPAAARLVAEQCLAEIGKPFEVDGKILTLGISIGITLHAGASVSTTRLLSQADVAMYQAKREGKGRFSFFDDSDRSRPREPGAEVGNDGESLPVQNSHQRS